MPCNCNKRGAARPRTFRPQNPPKTEQKPKDEKGTTQNFSLVQRDGSQETFGSRLEAEAARVRRGYRGEIRRG